MDNNEGIKPGTPPAAPADALREGAPQPPAPEIEPDLAEENAFFTPTNIVLLMMLFALVAYLLYKFNLEEMWNIAKAGLGLSFVIFIHELGHFLAAKWCNVNVTTFSIGFGPPIPGCWFRWGETTYKLAVIPLGGYVQMVGQVDGDESSDVGSEDDPRSYRNKTVGQRMLIISAGVIMNAILAIICFIFVYMVPGKEQPAAVISYIDSHAPAHEAGLRTGDKITQFGDTPNPTFDKLMQIVINSLKDEKITVKTQRTKDGKEAETQIEALLLEETSERPARPIIGIASPPRLQLASKREAREAPYMAGTPAAQAQFQHGDVIIAMTDPDDPTQIKEIPVDWRYPDKGQRDYFEFARRLQLLMDKDITLRIEREVEGKKETKDVTLAPVHRLDLGARMQMGQILTVRKGSSADSSVQVKGKLEGDVIESVTVKEADGKELVLKDKTLDPERLPMELRQWSDRLNKANFKGDRKVILNVRRHSSEAGPQFVSKTIELDWDSDWRFDRVVPISPNAPMPIPELGLAYEIKTIVADVTRANSPLKVGDVIKNLRYDFEGPKEEVKVPWMRDELKPGQWANVSFEIFQQPFKCNKLFVRVERDKKIEEIEIPVDYDKTWPLADRGWRLAKDIRRVKANDPFHAVQMGLIDTGNRMMEVFQNVRGMLMGRISVKNLGGPLTIARATYIFASLDFGEFVFFLGLISINLAVVNFLPIPVLDGGHMVFLIYEKLRGQPASETVRVVATYAGLAMILLLMGFVLWLDSMRLFF